jgi:hypothetical protein
MHLGRLIDGRSSESLRQPGEDGRWGVVEVLCHLRDWEMVIHERIGSIIEEELPELPEVDATMWPLEHEYREQDSIEVYNELAGLREALVGRLREISPAAWERRGISPSGQPVSLRGIVADVLLHDDHYLGEAREAVG